MYSDVLKWIAINFIDDYFVRKCFVHLTFMGDTLFTYDFILLRPNRKDVVEWIFYTNIKPRRLSGGIYEKRIPHYYYLQPANVLSTWITSSSYLLVHENI